jgi:hypothetical protein
MEELGRKGRPWEVIPGPQALLSPLSVCLELNNSNLSRAPTAMVFLPSGWGQLPMD